MENLAVIDLLSPTPDIGTLVVHYFSIVIDDAWTYFDGVWSKLMISEGGTWKFSAWLTIWCKNFDSALTLILSILN